MNSDYRSLKGISRADMVNPCLKISTDYIFTLFLLIVILIISIFAPADFSKYFLILSAIYGLMAMYIYRCKTGQNSLGNDSNAPEGSELLEGEDDAINDQYNVAEKSSVDPGDFGGFAKDNDYNKPLTDMSFIKSRSYRADQVEIPVLGHDYNFAAEQHLVEPGEYQRDKNAAMNMRQIFSGNLPKRAKEGYIAQNGIGLNDKMWSEDLYANGNAEWWNADDY